MSFIAYFGLGMALLFIIVVFGFVFFRLQATDHFSPTKQADRSAKKALRDAQL